MLKNQNKTNHFNSICLIHSIKNIDSSVFFIVKFESLVYLILKFENIIFSIKKIKFCIWWKNIYDNLIHLDVIIHSKNNNKF